MDKHDILKTMSEIQGVADGEEIGLQDFLPLNTYAMLSNPNKFLILGGRGTGKTKIFKTLLVPNGFEQIVGSEPHLNRPKAQNSSFIVGYDQNDATFPSGTVMSNYANDTQAMAFWAGEIVILILDWAKNDEEIQSLCGKYFDAEILLELCDKKAKKTPRKWISYFEKNAEAWESFLDDVDEYLLHADKWLFLLYDTLDVICNRYKEIFPYVRMLLSFWYFHSRRWKRLKCKIFLRNDLYESNTLNFPDSSKLKDNIMVLEWNKVSLYRLLIKRMANAGNQETLNYLHHINGLISQESMGDLGYLPTDREEIIRKFVEEMVGKYMGSGNKKGVSYDWAPNHLQDANGFLAPRSLLRCYSVAAVKMLKSSANMDDLTELRLLKPAMIQGAVQEVSIDRVQELSEAYPWLPELQRAFAGVTLLVSKKEFIDRIDMNLWSAAKQESLPATTPEGIFEYLNKLGIVFVAKDGRVNVPEIYLHGFGMKRKGGLRRPE